MLFTQIEFFVFLIILIAVLSFLKGDKIQKIALLISNFYFYGYFDYRFLILLIFSTFATFFIGEKLQNVKFQLSRNILLLLGLSLNISILAYFKYLNFFIESINNILYLNNSTINTINIIIPLGISFYTFRFISYLIDIYRKDTNTGSLLDFFLYGTFFPIIASGPISRAIFFIPQLNKIEISLKNLYAGFRLFTIGIFLKVFVADRIASYVNYFYDNHDIFDTVTTWMAALSYSIQIYCDFAGYSSMAIGIAIMVGLQIEENFNFPYLAGSIIDFWKRWHITLSLWIKDYLYIPLGGSRKGKRRKYINLLIAMILCGLWHGAAWTFVIWGFLHGILLVINHLWRGSNYQSYLTKFPRLYSFTSRALTFLSVTLCWVFFRSSNAEEAMVILQKLFFFNNLGVSWLHPFVVFILLSTFLFHCLLMFNFKFIILPIKNKFTLTILFCLIWLVIVFYPEEFQPFVYFQF